MRRNSQQEQSGGEGSKNYQAGGNIVVHTDLEEMRAVALSVYKENALELRGIAEDVALARADRLTSQFLNKLHEKRPEDVNALSDPDVQSVLFDAQSQYARSGEEDLGQTLVDLLADRAGEQDRTLRTLALNEAIHSAPKLTESQRRVVGLVFVLRYSRIRGVGNAEVLHRQYVQPSIIALASDLPEKSTEYQHIEYVGAGSVSITEIKFGDALRSVYGGLFTNGFAATEIPDDWPRESLASFGLRPALRDPQQFQVDAVSSDDIEQLATRLGKPHIMAELKRLSEIGSMSGEEVVRDLASYDPIVADVARRWDDSSAKNLTLTSVGLAIGHAYWRRVTGQDAPLSIWL